MVQPGEASGTALCSVVLTAAVLLSLGSAGLHLIVLEGFSWYFIESKNTGDESW